jgi:protein O-mannosyl-transferase
LQVVSPLNRERAAGTRRESAHLSWLPAAGILALVCLGAYWNSFAARLVFDNDTIILKDPRLTAATWRSVRDIFTHHYWWPSLDSYLYRPLTTLSYWFNYSVLGNAGSPFGYHAVNLLLHWANAVLAFTLVRGVSRRAWVALVAAAVFASHPLTAESVTNVVGRADLLAGMSVLGGLCLYRRFLGSAGWRRRAWLAALGVAYFAGVFCKESAVVLPGVMLLHDAAFPVESAARRMTAIRRSFARVWPAYLGIVPGLAVLLLARWVMFRDSALFGQFASDNPIVIAPLWTGVMTAVKVAGYYLALVIWPAALSCDYSFNEITLFGWTLASGQDPHAWLGLAAVFMLAAGWAVAWRRHRAVWFFLGFAAAAFLPTSNLLFPIGAIMAERLMYLPLVGATAAALLTVVAVGERVRAAPPSRGPVIAWTVVAVLVVAALTARTMARNGDWSSAERLWSSSAKAAPRSIKVHRALASIVMASDPSGGRVDEAIEIAMRGVRIADEAPLPLHHMPAALYQELGVYFAAKARMHAGRREPQRARAALGQGVAMLERAEDIDRAINRQGRERLLRRGLSPADVPDNGTPAIYRDLGWAYLESGDAMRAVETLRYLQRIRPGDAESHYVLGVAEGGASEVERARGDLPAAGACLERAAVNLIEATLLNPDHDAAWRTLERVYGLLAPSPAGVFTTGGRRSLNMGHPLVPGHLGQARAHLVRQLSEAGLREDAERWRQRLASESGRLPDTFVP